MFMGKKITASINNQKIEVKNQRNGNNKITDQIIGKNKKHLASNQTNEILINNGQQIDLQKHMKTIDDNISTRKNDIKSQRQIREKIDRKRVKQTIEKVEKVKQKTIRQQLTENTNQMQKKIKSIANSLKSNKIVDKSTEQNSVSQRIVNISRQDKNQGKIQIKQDPQQPHSKQQDQEQQLDGDQQFLQYQDQGEQQFMQRKIPQPFRQKQNINHLNSINVPKKGGQLSQIANQQNRNESPFNMEIFSLQLDQIMAKDYFVI